MNGYYRESSARVVRLVHNAAMTGVRACRRAFAFRGRAACAVGLLCVLTAVFAWGFRPACFAEELDAPAVELELPEEMAEDAAPGADIPDDVEAPLPEEMMPDDDDEAPPVGAPADEAPAGEAPAGEAPVGEAPAEDGPAPGQPVFEPEPVFEWPVPETPLVSWDGDGPAGTLAMNFDNAPLDAVLAYLSGAAGLIVVKEVEVTGRVSVLSRQSVTVEEAVDLLNTLLHRGGYAAVRTGRLLRIVALADAKKRNIPVRSGADPEAIKVSDEIITQIVPIRYADALKLQEDLRSLLPEYAQLTANASSNALILTDTSAGVRRIVEIVRELDRHMAATVSVRVFTLEFAEAATTARLINEVFDVEKAQQQDSSRSSRFREMFLRGGRSGGESESAASTGGPTHKVIAAGDDRTNTVVVSGPPDVLEVVAQVVEQIDSDPAEEQSVFIYPLRNADAASVAETLTQLFNKVEQSAVRTSGQSRTSPFSRSSQQPTQTTTAGDLDDVSVVADTDTNSLLVLTSTQNFDRVKLIIAELDRPVPQVLIKVLIAEVTHDDDIDLGVEFSRMNVRDSGRGTTIGTNFGLDPTANGMRFSIIEKNVEVAIHALQQVGKLEVLSRPYILASNNQVARITVGERVPFVRDTRITETGQTINTIQYEEIGIILEVTPHVNPEGLVTMAVLPEITVQAEDTVPIGPGQNAAKFATRSAETRVAINDGQTIVIGGLVQDRKVEQHSKTPLLGDIPLLGALFRRTQSTKVKTELLLFLTPHVAAAQEDLERISGEQLGSATLLEDAVAPGRFAEHIGGMKATVGARDAEKVEEVEGENPGGQD